jgi:hypothetical protein
VKYTKSAAPSKERNHITARFYRLATLLANSRGG